MFNLKKLSLKFAFKNLLFISCVSVFAKITPTHLIQSPSTCIAKKNIKLPDSQSKTWSTSFYHSSIHTAQNKNPNSLVLLIKHAQEMLHRRGLSENFHLPFNFIRRKFTIFNANFCEFVMRVMRYCLEDNAIEGVAMLYRIQPLFLADWVICFT